VDAHHPLGGLLAAATPVPSAVVWSTTTTTTVATTRARGLPAVLSGPKGLRHAALAATALAGTLAVLAHGGIRPRAGLDWSPPGSGDLDLVGVVLAAVSTMPVLAWRRSPLGVFAVTATASVLLVGLAYPLDVALGPAVALYLLAAHREREATWTLRTGAVVAGLFVAYVGAAAAHGNFPGPELLHSGLAWALAWFAGERTRLRRLHIAELQERARRAEREAEREQQLAAAEERARIARDLHDSAGHAISVIALRAGTARLRHHQDPDRSLRALEAIEDLARTTAEEIDHIVGSLRDSHLGGPVDPPPGLASLDTLVARHTAGGLAITVDTSGAPRPLDGAADRAAYRILQEALTNAARHGRGTARIELGYDAAALELTVTNPVSADRAARSGGRHGLIGMRERAALVGGELDTERTNGTFRVHARIPAEGHRACPGS
jgi:signal transduction histidine kinase